MQVIQAYLFFDGNCREAMQFYAGVLEAELYVMNYGEGPGKCPEGSEDRVIHANLSLNGESVLMASDTPAASPMAAGQNFDLCLNCTSREQQERVFAALSEEGEVRQPLQDTFWGAHFGMLRDRFGVGWMLNHPNSPA